MGVKFNNIKIKINKKTEIPSVSVLSKDGLNISYIDYENPEYLCFISVINGKLEIDEQIKNAMNFNEKEFYKLYYNTLIHFVLENNIKDCFGPILQKYKFSNSDIFSIKNIEILKKIYDDDEEFEKSLLLEEQSLKFWKRYSFIKHDKKTNTYKNTKKGTDFLFEFNSRFWIEKYKQLPNKYQQYFEQHDKVIISLMEDVNKSLNNEKKYMTINAEYLK